jgi:hypothetical protein
LLYVEEQQIDVELVPADVEVHLPAHQRGPGSELAQGFHDPVGKALFQVAFGHLSGQAQELEVVRIPGCLLGQLGLRRRQGFREVGRGGTVTLHRLARDHVQQDVAGPAVAGGCGGVPVQRLPVLELVGQDRDVAPRQLCNSLLHNWLRPGGGKPRI